MREILFRGKRKLDGEWLQGFLWEGNDSSYIIPHSLGITYYEKENRMMSFASEVDPETVRQYTGLTDKNGRKIFEGDIVKIPCRRDLGTVNFEIPECQYAYQMQDGDFIRIEENCSEVEVIGNIFDNPELIGDQP